MIWDLLRTTSRLLGHRGWASSPLDLPTLEQGTQEQTIELQTTACSWALWGPIHTRALWQGHRPTSAPAAMLHRICPPRVPPMPPWYLGPRMGPWRPKVRACVQEAWTDRTSAPTAR